MANVNNRYLKDENGEIFSPITSAQSVYLNGKSIDKFLLESYFGGNYCSRLYKTELSNYIKTGLYYCNDCTIDGVATENRYLIQITYTDGYCLQIMMKYNNPKEIYTRMKINNTWSVIYKLTGAT